MNAGKEGRFTPALVAWSSTLLQIERHGAGVNRPSLLHLSELDLSQSTLSADDLLVALNSMHL